MKSETENPRPETLDSQNAKIAELADRLDALAFEFWSEVEWDADVPGILAMEPNDPRIRDYGLRSAHKAMLRAVEELRLSIQETVEHG